MTQRGFTLIEVLVALVGLALMAGLSWRGLDSMMRTRDASQQRVDEVAVLQTALAQWRTDLDAVVSLAGTPALDWDGRVSFVLTNNLQLKKLTFADSVLEQSKAQGQRADDFDGNVLMVTAELSPLISDLVIALGGEAACPSL